MVDVRVSTSNFGFYLHMAERGKGKPGIPICLAELTDKLLSGYTRGLVGLLIGGAPVHNEAKQLSVLFTSRFIPCRKINWPLHKPMKSVILS